jgi:hypothetical protein
MNYRSAFKIGICALAAAAILAAGFAATPTYAVGSCPNGQSACMIVNSNQDTDARDAVLTLREAMLLDRGDLAYSALTPLEKAQVLGSGIDFAPDGIRGTYFNPTIFCDGCPSSVIVLSPPGFGGPAYALDMTSPSPDYMPPGFGGPASLPPGFGGPAGSSGGGGGGLMAKAGEFGLMTPPGFGGPAASVGLGLTAAGAEVAAKVVLDGSQLDSSTTGLRIERRGGWLRGLHLRSFSGVALQISDLLASDVLLGSNVDGWLDASEPLMFSGNRINVEYVGSTAE